MTSVIILATMTTVIATSGTGPDAGSARREARDLLEAEDGAAQQPVRVDQAARPVRPVRAGRATQPAQEVWAGQEGQPVPGARAAGTGLVVAGVREAYEEAAAHTAAAAYENPVAYEKAVASSWQVAPARPADRPALQALFAACSEESVRLRFFGQLRAFPGDYLDAALAGVPDTHDAVVVYRDGDRTRLAGLASLVAGPASSPDADPAELAVLVGDAWQRQGAGTAMITALLARARERGVARVRASVLPGRTALLTSLSRRLPPEPGRSSYTRDGLSVVYKLR